MRKVSSRTIMRASIRPAILLALCATAISLSCVGCEDPSAWELKGEVKFIELRELVDAQGGKKGSLDYSISNSGASKIEGCRFAFAFSTDKKKYHFTVVDESSIQSGAHVYGQVAIAYDGAEETGKLADAVIDSVQFK